MRLTLQLALVASLASGLPPQTSREDLQAEHPLPEPTCSASVKAPVLLQRQASLETPSNRSAAKVPAKGLLQVPPAASLGQTGKAAEAWDDIKEGLGVLLVLLLVAASSAFFAHRPSEKKENVKAPEAAAEVQEVTATEDVAGTADFEALLKVAVKAAAQRVGPKLMKAQAVKSILENRVYGFPDKAKTFIVDEIKASAGTFLTAVEAEEVMLMLDLDKSVTAKFPPMTTLLAGILSPTMLSFASWAFMAQLTIVILPVLCLCSWALYQDYGAECSIPTMLLWTKAQFGISLFLGLANGMVALKIVLGKRALDVKTSEMQDRIAVVKQKSLKEFGGKELRELFVCNSVLIEEALKLEDEVKSSIWHHAVGVGTCAWLVLMVWTFVLVFGWTFIPGVTAFSEAAKGVDNWCGAWASVFAARLSCVLALFFLAINLLTIGNWVVTLMVGSQSFAQAVLTQARNFDNNGLGLPLAEVFAKAFLLRGSSDTLGAKLSLAAAEKAQLQAERDALQSKLAELDGALQESSTAVESAVADVADPEAETRAAKELATNLEAFGEDAEQKAAAMTQATAQELERLLERFSGLAQQFQESEAYQTLASKAKELAETDLHTLAEDAAKQAAVTGEALQVAAQGAVKDVSAAAQQFQQAEVFQQAGQALESAGSQAKQAFVSGQEAVQQSEAYQQAGQVLASAGSQAGQVLTSVQQTVEQSEALQRAEQTLAAAGSQAQQVSEALRSRAKAPQESPDQRS